MSCNTLPSFGHLFNLSSLDSFSRFIQLCQSNYNTYHLHPLPFTINLNRSFPDNRRPVINPPRHLPENLLNCILCRLLVVQDTLHAPIPRLGDPAGTVGPILSEHGQAWDDTGFFILPRDEALREDNVGQVGVFVDGDRGVVPRSAEGASTSYAE